MTLRVVALVSLVAACTSGGEIGASSGSGARSARSAHKGSAGGFSASLVADLDKELGSDHPAAGSAATGGDGSAATGGDGSAATGGDGSGSAATGGDGSGSGSTAGSAATATPPATDDHGTSGAAPEGGDDAAALANRGPVKVPRELAAIKLDLEPNWDRDYGEAGTISFVLNVPKTAETKLFSFHYGYDPVGAPADRDAYKTWLGEQKLLDVTLDRQRGAAWYLEGKDAHGTPAWRIRVSYGGKQLVCYGSLYKTAAYNPLGDLRDKVVMAAKKICESLTL